jgi:hypothetical protein
MRRAINENPVVQAVLVGVMVILFAFLLFTRVLNQGSGSEAADTATTSPAAGTEAAGATATPPPEASVPETAAPEAAVPETTPAPGAEAGEAPTAAFAPGKGLPKNVVQAYEGGEVVALLIVRRRSIDDKPVKAAVEALNLPDVAVFVTGAKDIARYSQITQGVGVSRTPALVVVRPRNLDEGTPVASVSYGFRGPESVAQAIRDALYKGNKVPYYPE